MSLRYSNFTVVAEESPVRRQVIMRVLMQNSIYSKYKSFIKMPGYGITCDTLKDSFLIAE
jgi:hypothetical protein